MNILLTSAGRRRYMIDFFKNALENLGKVYASNSVLTYALLKADDYVITPNIYDDNYISFLIDYSKKNNIDCIIPLFDIDLPVLSANKEKFDNNGIRLVLSDYKQTLICNDKWLTYEFLQSIGLPQKRSYVKLDLLLDALDKKVVNFPFIIKPRWGMGSIGVYLVENIDELEILYKKLKKEIFSTYLSFESEANKEECIIMQEYIKGEEYGIEILNDLNANYVATFAKKKISMRSGETDIAKTINISDFESLSHLISINLKHVGILDIDCIKDDEGNLFVLEMNCRFGGQYPFTHNSGVDVPKQIVEWLLGKPTNLNLLKQKDNIMSCKDINPVIISI